MIFSKRKIIFFLSTFGNTLYIEMYEVNEDENE